MTKSEMIDVIAQKAGITKKAAGAALGAVSDAITGELKKGRSVVLTGFGTFKVSNRAARTGVNPRNPSEKIKIPAMKVPTFKAGKSLKEAVRLKEPEASYLFEAAPFVRRSFQKGYEDLYSCQQCFNMTCWHP